jgi:lysozyme family protein
MTPQQAIERVIALEGGYTLHQNPTEPQATYAGIYRAANPLWVGWQAIDKGQQPDKKLVIDFYLINYWQPFAAITNDNMRYIMFEYAVNAGVKQAIKAAQRTVGISDDGVLGKITAATINAMPEKLFITSYMLTRAKAYLDLANKDQKKYGGYLRGWLNRLFDNDFLTTGATT